MNMLQAEYRETHRQFLISYRAKLQREQSDVQIVDEQATNKSARLVVKNSNGDTGIIEAVRIEHYHLEAIQQSHRLEIVVMPEDLTRAQTLYWPFDNMPDWAVWICTADYRPSS